MTGRTGRPVEFTDDMQTRYLAALANGANLGEAAVMVGLGRSLPTRYVRTSPEFATAVAEARALGKVARVRNLPHNEYRYNVHRCRCPRCTAAARKGRAGRRAAAADETTPGTATADILTIRPEPKSPSSFLLPRAS
ncbi:hypothetical protein ACWCPT_29765 [Streptomyces sp. NPDC002308]